MGTQQKIFSIRKKLMLSFLLMAILATAIPGYLYYKAASSSAQLSLETLLKGFADLTSSAIHPNRFSQAIEEGMESEAFQETYAKLNEIMHKAHVTYLYTFVKNDDGNICFAVDGSDDPDDLFVEYPDPEDEIFEAFDGSVIVTAEAYYDETCNQYLLTGYAPLYDQNGNAIAIIGADLDISEVRALKRVLLYFLGGSMAVSIILALILGWFMSKRISMPLVQITERIQKMAADGSDLTQRVQMDSNDEVRLLAEATNKMFTDIGSIVRLISNAASEVDDASSALNMIATQNAAATVQLSQANEELAQEATDQAAQMDQAVDNVSSITSMLQQTAAVTKQLKEQASDNVDTTVKGTELVTESASHLTLASQSMNTLGEKMQDLRNLTQEISDMVVVISRIALQTDRLALNSAIEAARAGEKGKGFGVVAKQVRQLAEQVNSAAASIAELAESSRVQTNSATQIADENSMIVSKSTVLGEQISRLFSDINANASKMAVSLTNISANIEKQTKSTVELSDFVQQVALVSEKTSASAQEAASTTQSLLAHTTTLEEKSTSLAELSKKLTGLATRFKIGDENSAQQ